MKNIIYSIIAIGLLFQFNTAQAEILPRTIPDANDSYWKSLHIISDVRINPEDSRWTDFFTKINSQYFVDSGCVQNQLSTIMDHEKSLRIYKSLETYISAERTYVLIVGFSSRIEAGVPITRRAIVCQLK